MDLMTKRSLGGIAITAAAIAVGCGGQNGTSFQSDSGGYTAGSYGANQYGTTPQSGGGPLGNSVTLYGKEGETLYLRDGEGPWIKLDTVPSTTYDDLPLSSSAVIRDPKGRYSFAAIQDGKIEVLDTTVGETPVATFEHMDKSPKVVQIPAKVTGYNDKDERLRVWTNVRYFNSDDKPFAAYEGSDVVVAKEPAKPAVGEANYPVSAKGFRVIAPKSKVDVDLSSKETFDYSPVSLKGYTLLQAVWEGEKEVIEPLPAGDKDGGVTFLAPPASALKPGDHFSFFASKPFKTARGQSGDTGLCWTAPTTANFAAPKNPNDVVAESAKVEKPEQGRYRFNFAPQPGYNVFFFTSKEIPGAKKRTIMFEVTKGRVNAKNGANFAYITPDLSKIGEETKAEFKSAPVDFDMTSIGTGGPHPLEGADLFVRNRLYRLPVGKDTPGVPGFDKNVWCIASYTKVRADN